MHDDGNHLHSLRANRLALFLFACFALLATIMGAIAAPLTVIIPGSVQEGQSVTATVSGSGTISILLNEVVIASGSGSVNHLLPTNSSSAGLLSYRFISDDPDVMQEQRTVVVQDVPLTLQVTSPVQTDLATQTVTFSVSTNLPPELCYVVIDGASTVLTAQSPMSFSKTLQISEGIHALQYKCKLGEELPALSRSILIDSIAPRVTAASPNGEVTGAYVTMSVDTDEIAKCRYGAQDAAYASLPNAMSAIYATRNAVTIPVERGGPQTYFVRCEDVRGTAMLTPAVLSFVTKLSPVGKISLEGEEPLKAGTYEVELTTNVPLSQTPILSYTLQETGKTQQIGLTGANTEWSGFIIIPEGTLDTVLSFLFEGQSIEGIVGRDIVEGKIVTLDASPPAVVKDLTITNTSTALHLRWTLEDATKDIAYNIYRSSKEEVELSDFYTSTRSSEYADTAAGGARYYYYRVAAVDPAGNIGPLSDEVWGSAIDEAMAQETGAILDPLSAARLDEEIVQLRAAIIDTERAIASLESEANPSKIRIINDMHFLDDARNMKDALEELHQLLSSALSGASSRDEIANYIDEARKAIASARGKLVVRISPEQEANWNQISDDSGLENNLAYALIGKELSANDRDAYFSESMALQDHLTVSAYASSFSVTMANGVEQKFTYVKKHIALDSPANDITLVEVIPKIVASDVDEIRFDRTPEVLERDPVISYQFPVLQQEEYGYVVQKIVPLEDVKAARTFAYPTVSALQQTPDASSSATGLVTGSWESLTGSLDGIIVVVGIMIIVGLLVYYLTLTTDPKPFKGLPRLSAPMQQSFVSSQPTPVRSAGAPVRIVRTPISAPVVLPRAVSIPEEAGAQLHRAEALIDNRAYDEALREYRATLTTLRNNSALQQTLAKQTLRVYSKLLLHKRLDDAAAAIERKDIDALHQSLADARQLAEEIGNEETPLIINAKEAYERFAKSVNTLELERMSKY